MWKYLLVAKQVNNLLEHDGNEEWLNILIATSLSQRHTTAFNFTTDQLRLGLMEFAEVTVMHTNGQVQIFNGHLAKTASLVLKMDTMRQI